ncbi:hypothetical protein AMS68_003641 [Peltaster fructicola]|uniref:SWR1-complex protein 4 n=1 Tax=Peltaster fructicola TaxID=286661 RepID=A0A6H0XTR1_9PEZI|nr:hypothetical protein AMS68_003641 [Peltaster fructicola]
MADIALDRRPSAPARPFKRARITRPTAHWERVENGARKDIKLTHWQKPSEQPRSFDKFNTEVSVPQYDDETYEKYLQDEKWTREETDYLVDIYRECAGKWPVIVDRYDRPERTMEELKARFYQITAAMMQVATPIQSMNKSDYDLYEMLLKFNPSQEASRKRLAEGHLQRRQNEVDEEAVLLAELQRIMANQTWLDSAREELRERLDYPHANSNSYQYTTSQALTTLWQQLIAADRLRKGGRVRPIGPQSALDTAPASASRQRESNAGMAESTRLSEKDMARYGVVHAAAGEKLSGGIVFASDKLSKPRIAKSQLQTEKIATILTSIGVPDLIPLPTPPVVEAFDNIMAKLHTLLDMRKLAEKEEQEVKVREAEATKMEL